MKAVPLTPCTPMLDEKFKLSLLGALFDLASVRIMQSCAIVSATLPISPNEWFDL